MTERGRRRCMALLPVLACLVSVMGLSVFWLHEYRQAAFTHVSAFCEIMAEKSPEMEVQVLSAMKEYAAQVGQRVDGDYYLTQYGYANDVFCKGPGWGFFVLPMALFFVNAVCFLSFAAYEDGRKRMRIAELGGYLERVNKGAGGTLIQKSEDEFSHLQDEMYKTVTALWQTREEAVAAKLNFADNLANIAHQLKTPITAALLSLQLMEKEAPLLRGKGIKRQLERLGSLEEALLTLARIDAGTLPLECSRVDIYTALSLAAENLQDLLEKEQISVSVSEKGCVEIEGDLEWTMEAFLNLMKNCMEHSPRKGTIHCDYSENPLYVEILIWDEGKGFCPEEFPHLFERFYRGKEAGGSGTGIGLSLARSILELQNGSLTACNLPGGGACFEIRIYRH